MTMQEKVRPGYKQTDIGLVPEDWDVVLVDDLVMSGVIEKPMDGNHGAIHPKSSDFVDFGVPFVMANHVYQGVLDLDTCPHISRKQADSLQKGFARSGDILLTHKATIGETAIVGKTPFDYIMLTPQVTYYRVRMPEKINRDYLFHYFNGSIFQEHLKLLSGGGTRSYIGITAQRLLRVVLPRRIVEQNAIADALSDADARIAALEALIAKKRDLKQGAMQQLLTGETRLPGFSGEWEVKQLGDITHIKTGKRNNQDKMETGEFPFFVRSETVERIDSYSHDCEAILVPGEGNIGDIFHYINGKFDVHQRVYAITQFAENVSGKYVHLWMRMNFGAHAMQNTVKATVDSLRLPTFQNFQLLMPPTIDEQTAIAEILSDMDAELAALDAEAEKARTIKQGMMQNLLTGKVRLV